MSHSPFVSRSTFLFGAGVLLILVSLCITFAEYGYDDPYITFRYARNLAQGNGFVYNVGEPVLSTTTPGYALILAALGLVYGDIPLLGNVLSVVGLGIGATSLYWWAQRAGQPFVGWIAGSLLLTFPLLFFTLGSEMCLYIGTLLGGFCLYAEKRLGWAMALIGLATLIRPDGVLAASLIILHFLWMRRRIPWAPIAIYALILLPWIAYATWTFGSPVPVTLSTKQAQERMIISDSFTWGAWTMFRSYVEQPLYWSFLPLGAVGLWQIVTRKRQWLVILVWTVGYFVGYAVLDVTRCFWYYAPLVPGVVLVVAVGLDWVRARVACWKLGRSWQWTLILLLLASMLWSNSRGLHYVYTHPDRRLTLYRQAGQWIDANLPVDASVGTLEVGIIGYYAQRRIIGFAGLLQPEAARLMEAQTTYQDVAAWAIRTYEPDYVLLGDWYPSLVQSSEFTSRYVVEHLFEKAESGFGPLFLYQVY